MADIESNIKVNIDTSDALSSIRLLQAQISAFHQAMQKAGAANAATSAQMQKNLVDSINATGKFNASIQSIKTSSESFTTALEKNKLSMGEYFRYAGASTKTFGKLFATEFATINNVARERVKDLQTQYIKLGRDANGAMQAIKVRPLSLDMNDLGTKTAIAAQRQQLLNQLLKQGSTNMLNFGKNTQWAGRQLMVGFTVPLAMMGQAAAQAYKQIEEASVKFRRVYGDMNTTSKETDKMVESVRTLANEYTKYGVAVADTMDMAAQAAAMGKTGVDLLAQINQANKLAVLGGVDQQKALETTTSLTNAFGLAADQLAGKINFLNAVENQTVLSIEDMTVAIPKAAPVVKQLGGSVEDLTYFLTAMREGGINASEGANALKSGLASMINPTAKASAFLQGFGINVKGIVEADKGNLKKTVLDFAKALDTLDPLNRARAIEQMFGKFQFARMSTLFKNVIDQGSQANKVAGLAVSTAEELAVLSEREMKKVSDSPLYKFQKAVEDIKAKLAPIGAAFLKAVTPIIQFVGKLLDKFNGMSDGMKNVITGITLAVAGIGPVLLMTFGLIANGVANIIKLFANIKSFFNRRSNPSSNLSEQTTYLTSQQIEAAAVAASLDQAHSKLNQTFTSEASAVDKLTASYRNAIAAQQAFRGVPGVPVGALVQSSAPRPVTAPPVKKYATGVSYVPGPKGAGDIVPALLSPGEAVIPVKHADKYRGLIQGMVDGTLPGYASGRYFTSSAPAYKSEARIAYEAEQKRLAEERANSPEGKARAAANKAAAKKRMSHVFLYDPKTAGDLTPEHPVALRMIKDQGFGKIMFVTDRSPVAFTQDKNLRVARNLGLSAGRYETVKPERINKLGDFYNVNQYGSRGGIIRRFSQGTTSAVVAFGAHQPFTVAHEQIANLGKDMASKSGSTFMQYTTNKGKSSRSILTDATKARLIQESIGVPPTFVNNPFGLMEHLSEQGIKEVTILLGEDRMGSKVFDLAASKFGIKLKKVGITRPKGSPSGTETRMAVSAGDKAKFSRLIASGASQATKDAVFNELSTGMGRFANGVFEVPGPKGAGDVVPALLSPGEAVVPARFAKKYSKLINGMVAGNVPGYASGKKSDPTPEDVPMGNQKVVNAKTVSDVFKVKLTSAPEDVKKPIREFFEKTFTMYAEEQKAAEAAAEAAFDVENLPESKRVPKRNIVKFGDASHIEDDSTKIDIGGGKTASLKNWRRPNIKPDTGDINRYIDSSLSRGSSIKMDGDKIAKDYIDAITKASGLDSASVERELLKLKSGTHPVSRESYKVLEAVATDDVTKNPANWQAAATSARLKVRNNTSGPGSYFEETAKMAAAGGPNFPQQKVNSKLQYDLKTALAQSTVKGLIPREVFDEIAAGITIDPKTGKVVIDKVMASARAAAEINSPSKRAQREVGQPIADGISAGITDGGNSASIAVERVIDDVADTAQTRIKVAAERVRTQSEMISATNAKLYPGIAEDAITSQDKSIRRHLEKVNGKMGRPSMTQSASLEVGFTSQSARAAADKESRYPGLTTVTPQDKSIRRQLEKLQEEAIAKQRVIEKSKMELYGTSGEVTQAMRHQRKAQEAQEKIMQRQAKLDASQALQREQELAKMNSQPMLDRQGKPIPDVVRENGSVILGEDGAPIDQQTGESVNKKPMTKFQKFRKAAFTPTEASGRASNAAMMATTAVGMATMIPGQVGQAAQKMLGPLTLASTAMSMIPGPAGMVAGGLVAVGAAAMEVKKSLDKAREEAFALAKSMGDGNDAMQKFAVFAGKVSGTEAMDKRRAANATGFFNVVPGKTTFGESFMKSDAGAQMLASVNKGIKSGGLEEAKSAITQQLSTAISSGVMTVEQARSIAANLGAQMKDVNFGMSVTANLTDIYGPSGENLKKDPLKVRMEVMNTSMDRLDKTAGGLQKFQARNVNSNIGKAALGAVGGGLVGAGAGFVAGGLMAGIGAGAASGAAAGAAGGSVAPGIGTAIGAGLGIIAGITVALYKYNKQVSEMSGALSAQIGDTLQVQQQMVDSLQIDYEKRYQIAQAAGDTAEATRLQNKYLIDQKALLETQATNTKKVYKTVASQSNSVQKKVEDTVDKSIESVYKDENAGYAKTVSENLGNTKGTRTQRIMLKQFVANKQLGLDQADAAASTFGGTDQGMNLLEKVAEKTGGGVGLNRALTVSQNMSKAQQVDFMFKISSQTPAVAKAALDSFELINKTTGAFGSEPLTQKAILDFYEKDPKKALSAMHAIDKLSKLKGKDLNVKAVTEMVGPDVGAVVKKYSDSFAKYSKPAKITYVTELQTIMTMKNDKNMQNSFKQWQKVNAGAKDKSFEAFANEKADTTVTTQNADNAYANTGPKEPPKPPTASWLDEIVAKSREVVKANQNMTTGWNASMAALKKLAKDGKDVTSMFGGLNQQMRAAGASQQLIDYANANPNDAKKIFKNGKLTSQGKTIDRMLSVNAVNDFGDQTFASSKASQDQAAAFEAISKTGADATTAYTLAGNAALAHGIAALTAAANTEKEKRALAGKIKVLTQMANQQEALARLAQSPQQNIIDDANAHIETLQAGVNEYQDAMSLIAESETAINKAYDERVKALDEVASINDTISKQQQGQMSLADALTKGDIAAAAKAAQDMQQQNAVTGLNKQKKDLQDSRERALAAVTVTIGDQTFTRAELEKNIADLNHDILTTKLNQIDPANKVLAAEKEKHQVLIAQTAELIKQGTIKPLVNTGGTDTPGNGPGTGGGGSSTSSTTSSVSANDAVPLTTTPNGAWTDSTMPKPKADPGWFAKMLGGFKAGWDNFVKQPWVQSIAAMAIGTYNIFIKPIVDWIVKLWGKISAWFKEHVIDPIVKMWNIVATWVDKNVIEPIKKAWSALSDWFGKNVIDPIKNAWNAFTGWIDQHLFKPFRDFFAWFNSDKSMEDKIKDVENWWKGVIAWFAKLPASIGKFFTDSWNNIVAWIKGIPAKIGQAAGNLWNGIKGIGHWLGEQWTHVSNWFKSIPAKVGTVAGNIWNGIKSINAWVAEQELKLFRWVMSLPEKIANGAKKLWDGIKGIGSWLNEQLAHFKYWFMNDLPFMIGQTAGNIWNGIKGIGSWLQEQGTKLINWIKDTPKRIADNAISMWNGIKGIGSWLGEQWDKVVAWIKDTPNRIAANAINMWNGLKSIGSWLAEQWTNIQTWFTTTLPEAIKTWASNWWSNVKSIGSWLGEQWDKVKTWFTTTLPEAIKTWAQNWWAGVKSIGSWLGDQWDKVKTWFSVTLPTAIKTWAKNWWHSVQSVGSWLSQQWQHIHTWFSVTVVGGIKRLASNFWHKTLPGIGNWLKEKKDDIVDWFKSLPGKLKATASNFWHHTLPDIGKFFSDKLTGLIAWFKDLPKKIGNGIKNAWSSITGGLGHFWKKIVEGFDSTQNRAEGGHIKGKGTGTSDDIPAMLSNGEFVVRAAAVKKVGVGFLNDINQADRKGFANGGMVGVPAFAGGGLFGGIGDFFGGAVKNVSNFIGGAVKNVKSVASSVVNNKGGIFAGIGNMVSKGVGMVGKATGLDKVAAGFKNKKTGGFDLFGGIGNFVGGAVKNVGNFAKGVINSNPILKNTVSFVGGAIKNVGKVAGQVTKNIGSFAKDAWKNTGDFMKSAGKWVSDVTPGVLSFIKDYIFDPTNPLDWASLLIPGGKLFATAAKVGIKLGGMALKALPKIIKAAPKIAKMIPGALKTMESVGTKWAGNKLIGKGALGAAENTLGRVGTKAGAFGTKIGTAVTDWTKKVFKIADKPAVIKEASKPGVIDAIKGGLGKFKEVKTKFETNFKLNDKVPASGLLSKEGARDAWKTYGTQVAGSAIDRLARTGQRAVMNKGPAALMDFFSGAQQPAVAGNFANGGMVKYFANGGFAKGSDTIAAMLTPGEFVVKKSAADRIGGARLNEMNHGKVQTQDRDSVYNYSINVNVKSDADANDIARTVMTQIRQIDSQRIRGNQL